MSLSHLSVYFVKATSSYNIFIILYTVMYSSYYYVFHTHWYLQCTNGLIMNPSITMILDILISVLIISFIITWRIILDTVLFKYPSRY